MLMARDEMSHASELAGVHQHSMGIAESTSKLYHRHTSHRCWRVGFSHLRAVCKDNCFTF